MRKRALLWLGTFGSLLYLALGLYWNYQAPRTGVDLAWSGEAWQVMRPAAGLRAGDLVQSFQGAPVTLHTFLVDNVYIGTTDEYWSWLKTRRVVAESLTGETAVFGVERDGQEVEVSLPLSRGNWDFLSGSTSSHLLVGLVFLLVGWATYRPSGDERKTLWFYLLCLSMSLVYLSNALCLMGEFGLQPTFFRYNNIFNNTNFVLAPTLLLHFSLLMPRDRTRPWLLALPYAAAAYAILAFDIPFQGMLVALLFLSSLLTIAQGAWSYRGILERQQMKWVGVGFLLGLGPWIVLNGLPLLIWGERLLSDTVPGACLVFIPIFMAVAVRKYRLFDVGTFLESTALYLATLALLLGVDILVLSFLDQESVLSEGALVSLAFLVGVYGPTRAALTRVVTRYAHRSSLSSEELEERLDAALQGSGPEEVSERLKMVVQEYISPESLQELEEDHREPGVYLQLEELATVTLVVASGQALHCGPLPGGRVYSSEVMRRLEELVKRSSLYYQAVFQAREADLERQRRLDERERLLGDLHDGIGAALSSIRMTSEEERVSRLAGDALFELQSFLYPGPGYTLSFEQFVSELRGYGNSVFSGGSPKFTLVAEGLEGGLERNKALSVFRLVKEAMNNTLKHAEASEFVLRFSLCQEEPRTLMLELSDDGVGLSEERGKGRGMDGMRGRAERLGGSFHLESGKGLTLKVEVPL